MDFSIISINDFDEFILLFYTPSWYQKIKNDFEHFYSYNKETRTICIDGNFYLLPMFLTYRLIDVFHIEPQSLEDFEEMKMLNEIDRKFLVDENGNPKVYPNECYALTKDNITFKPFIHEFRQLSYNSFKNAKDVLEKDEIRKRFINRITQLTQKAKEQEKDYLNPLIEEIKEILKSHSEEIPDEPFLELVRRRKPQNKLQNIFIALSTEKFEFNRPLVDYIRPNDYPNKELLLQKVLLGDETEITSKEVRFQVQEEKNQFYRFLISIEEIINLPNIKQIGNRIFINGDPFNYESYAVQKSKFKKKGILPIQEILALKNN